MLLLGKVEGMEVGLTLGLEVQEGKLKLSLAQCGCLVKDISIKLDGGASWLYQGYGEKKKKESSIVFILISGRNQVIFWHSWYEQNE